MSAFGEFFKREKETPPPAASGAVSAPVALGSLLSPETILITDHPGKKSELLKKLVEMIAAKNPNVRVNTAFQAVMEREKVTTTFLDSGIGLPHARLANITDIHAGLAIIPPGLSDPTIKIQKRDENESETKNTEPLIHIVFLFLSAEGEFAKHLQTLSRASWLFKNPDLKDELMQTKTPSDAITLIQEAERQAPNGSQRQSA